MTAGILQMEKRGHEGVAYPVSSSRATSRHGHAASQPQRQGSVQMADPPGSPGARRWVCRLCSRPSSGPVLVSLLPLACLHGPALRQVRVKPWPQQRKERKVESSGHHHQALHSQWNKNKPLHRLPRLLPLGPGPGSEVSSKAQTSLFAPAQEALPVLRRPLLPASPSDKDGQPRTAGGDRGF